MSAKITAELSKAFSSMGTKGMKSFSEGMVAMKDFSNNELRL